MSDSRDVHSGERKIKMIMEEINVQDRFSKNKTKKMTGI